MPRRLPKPQLEAWRAFLMAHAAIIERIEKVLSQAGCIPLTWYDVLIVLSRAPEQRLRMHELASALVISRSGLTRVVDRLVARGFIMREVCSSDGRGSYAVLTPQGFDELKKTWPFYRQGIMDYFSQHVSREEVEVLTKVMQRLYRTTTGDPYGQSADNGRV